MMKSKKLWGRIRALGLSLALMIGILAIPAGAAKASDVTAELRPNVTILVDGQERTFYNVQGQEVHPIFYNGTHYLPVRAIGELMGKNVNWDQSTLTVTLAGVRTTGTVTGTPDSGAQPRAISVQLRPDFTIVVDDTVRRFTDARGNAVYPMLYSGTTYLPIRAIGELMGKEVGWDSQRMTVTLSAPDNAGGLVTDADSFGSTRPGGTQGGDVDAVSSATERQGQTSSGGNDMISVEEARSKALAHAGLAAGQVTFVKQKLEWDNGRRVYEIEFYTADRKEYDYEIDAYSGQVISFDYDAENYQYTGGTANGGSTAYIGAEKAKSIALKAAGVSAAQAKWMRCHLERDHGQWEYSVEFYYGDMEYEYEIDALTGRILSMDVDSIYD